MRELAVQAANDTNNSSDRASRQADVKQLRDELDRIAETTTFNGNNTVSDDTGGVATLDGGGALVLTAADGRNIDIIVSAFSVAR